MNGNARSAYRPMPAQWIVAVEGYPFLALCLLCVFAGFSLEYLWLIGGSSVAALFIAFFFRNPERVVPSGENLCVAPADGRVVAVKNDVSMPLTGRPAQVVSIFLSILNVHMNRVPCAGRIQQIVYQPGRFLIAANARAAEENERNLVLMTDDYARDLVIAQVAGWVARRIICYRRVGEAVKRGERLGLIRFGSRVDLYLPLDCTLAVSVGDRVQGGTTVMGRWS